MSHILGLIQQFGHAEITNFDLVFLAQEHVGRFDVSMQDLVLMQVTQSQAHFYEELPDLSLLQRSIHLLLQMLANVTILTILHNYID